MNVGSQWGFEIMPRPHKPRKIGGPPEATVFKPAGIPAHDLDWITMTLDEYEAVRLVDGEGLQQEEGAELMDVSRPTVTRILARGRRKLAQMLTKACALTIEGGVVCQRGGRGRGKHGRGGRHGRDW
jgi:predicted DNA-binding protein (UPF0251 family)